MVSVLSLMGDRDIRERSDNTNIQHNNHRISFKLFGTVYLLKLRKIMDWATTKPASLLLTLGTS